MRLYLFAIAFLVFNSPVFAQNTALRGIVRDSATGNPVGFVSVGLFSLPDSMLVSQAATDEQGRFALPSTRAGRYLLKTNLVGYITLNQMVQLPEAAAVPMEIELKPGDNILGEVTVQEDIIPILMNGDTVMYNAGAFQVKENAVAEDLFKKLPGIEVDRQGNIKAMGQEVRQVLVDGKPFFGNDPKAATRNLPADAIDQVKVYDKRSDQSAFSGFDDGSGEKVIDIRLKADRRRGRFGRFTGGYGTNDRYSVNGMFNKFSPREQLSLIGSANNINDFGFSFDEMLQSGLVSVNGGGGVGEGDGESAGGVVIRNGGSSIGNQQAGIARSFATGLNYWRDISPKLAIDGNLMLSGADTRLEQQLWRQNFFPDSTVDYRQNTTNRDQRINPRLRLEMDWKWNSLNTLNLKTNGSYTDRHANDLRDYSFGLPDQQPFSTGINRLKREIDRSRANATLLWKRNFRKKGHTFSTQLQAMLLPAQVLSNNDFLTTDTLQQQSNQEELNSLIALKSSYTRPLRKRNRFVEMTYSAAQSHWETDKNTFDFDPDIQAYSVRNPFFSNGLEYDFFNQQIGVNYRRQRLRHDYGFGFATQHSFLDAAATTGTDATQQHFFHFLPNAHARFNLGKTANLRFRLQSAIQPPAARYLLPAPDNTNPQILRLSNPDLRPEQRYSLQTNYQNFKMGALTTLMGMSSITYIRDRVSSDIERSATGQQIVRPINTTGGMTATAFGMWSTPLLHRKLRFSTNINNVINSGYGFLDGQKNNNLLWVKGGGARLSHEKRDVFFVEVGMNINHNYSKNAVSIPAVNQFWSYSLESGSEFTLPKGWKINADVSWNRYLGQSTTNNTDFLLINGSIGKRFLKKEAGFLEISVNDALNQNLGVERTPGDGYLEEISNRILRRYVLLKFTYRLLPKGSGGAGSGTGEGVRIRF